MLDWNTLTSVFLSSDVQTPARRHSWSVFVIQMKSPVFTMRRTTIWWVLRPYRLGISALTFDIPGGSNRRSNFQFDQLKLLVPLSSTFFSVGSTISIIHSPLRAAPNSFFMILQVLRLEVKHRLRKSNLSLQNVPSRPKYMINSTSSGQSAFSKLLLVLNAYILCVTAGIALSQIEQGFYWTWTRDSSKKGWQEMVSNCFDFLGNQLLINFPTLQFLSLQSQPSLMISSYKFIQRRWDLRKAVKLQVNCWMRNLTSCCVDMRFLPRHIYALKVWFSNGPSNDEVLITIVNLNDTDMHDDDSSHQDQVKVLIEKTADSLDKIALKMLFVSIQQNNLELCIRYAIQ